MYIYVSNRLFWQTLIKKNHSNPKINMLEQVKLF